jgi:group I intron endonuclease
MFGIIYKITNKINGKVYIGQTVRLLQERIKSHVRASKRLTIKSYFLRALKKYGLDAFEWMTICECFSRKELDDKEIFYIKELNTVYPNGYNITLGGGGMSGFKHSEKTLNKVRGDNHWTRRLGITEETKNRISKSVSGERNGFYGKKHTLETNQKNGEKHRGLKLTNETKEKISKSNKGKKKTEEHKKNISKGRKGMVFSDEHRKHLSEATKKVWNEKRINDI